MQRCGQKYEGKSARVPRLVVYTSKRSDARNDSAGFLFFETAVKVDFYDLGIRFAEWFRTGEFVGRFTRELILPGRIFNWICCFIASVLTYG